jgi:ketosteroid isomerase-like protein
MQPHPATESLPRDFAEHFAVEWVAAWNAHDLDRILAHYADDFTMTSPYIAPLAGEPSGTLRGKEQVRRYWQAALEKMPSLRFELLHVLLGVRSIVLSYRNHEGRLAAECFCFDDTGRVAAAGAHYSDPA